jgi:tetratricopeptide (TPR) repeat protein
VESVAWVAERKDVLSTFFGLLAIGAYVAYARRPGPLRYGATGLLFAASLLAKPMLVTLPLLFLLLDAWPLARLPSPFSGDGERLDVRRWLTLAAPKLVEKLPFLVLSVASGIVTVLAQVSDTRLTNVFPLAVRALNAVLSVARYLEKTAAPWGLAAHYPYPSQLRLEIVMLYAGVLGSLTLLAVRAGRGVPALLVGWLWYLVSLLPVIGLFQVGTQSMADRYTYVPLIGIFLAIVWGADTLRERTGLPRALPVVIGGVLLALLCARARSQVLVWRDTRTLFGHAISVTGGSSEAFVGLGLAELEDGDLEAAAEHFRTAKRYFPPTYVPSLLEGNVALRQGRKEAAERAYLEAITLSPTLPDGYFNLGSLYLQIGQPERAVVCLEKVLALAPAYPHAADLLEMARRRAAEPPS